MDLSKSYEKITLYEILLKTSFSAFLLNFGNISAKCRIRQSVVSAKCLFGKVVFGEVSWTLDLYSDLFLHRYCRDSFSDLF